MRNRLVLGSFALVLVTAGAGCGVFGGDDDDVPAASAPDVAPPDRPEPPPALEGTPTPSDLDESLGVFVVSGASANGDGTRAHPFGTIAQAVAAAKPAGKRVYVCAGTYAEAVVIEDGISMVGGLDCSTPTWAIGNGRSRIDAPQSPAVTAKGVTRPTRFERFEVTAPDATEPSGTSIGLRAEGSPALTIASSRIAAGNGAKGEDGAAAIQLVQTGDIDGAPGKAQGDFCADKPAGLCQVNPKVAPGGLGGKSVCTGGAPIATNAGGDGGTGGIWKSNPQDATHAVPWWNEYQNLSTWGAKPGVTKPGGAAAEGADGASATTPGAMTREGFVPADGTAGTDGEPGKAGSGGSGYGPTVSARDQYLFYGNSGSGGGAGGCPGLAGGAGKGGGASIGALLVDSPMTFHDVEIAARNGGDGGKGVFGSLPTPGGEGGPMISGLAGTKGAPGTAGGEAGISGSGAGGSSFGLVHAGGAPTLEQTKPAAGIAGRGAAAQIRGDERIEASASGEAADVVAL